MPTYSLGNTESIKLKEWKQTLCAANYVKTGGSFAKGLLGERQNRMCPVIRSEKILRKERAYREKTLKMSPHKNKV